MRQVVDFLVVFVIAVVLLQCQTPAAHALGEPVAFSQVIRPLQCSVDVVAVGTQMNVRLLPAECEHSTEARLLLAKTRAALR